MESDHFQLRVKTLLAKDLAVLKSLARFAAELTCADDQTLAEAVSRIQTAGNAELGRCQHFNTDLGLEDAADIQSVLVNHPVVLRKWQHAIETEDTITVIVAQIDEARGDVTGSSRTI